MVQKAYNQKANRMSALKIIKKERISTIEQVDQLIREREILKILTSYQLAAPPTLDK